MAITYPLNHPTTIGFENIELRAVNAVATTQSPFTFKQQIIRHQGQRWEATVTIPTALRDIAAEWKAFLVALKGQTGTFLLGDPDYASPRGSVAACTLTGSAGDETAGVTMTGNLLAGDYIQLGSGSSARLHKVLQDRTGSGDLEIWPKLRANYSSATVTFNNPKGVFRLSDNITTWEINQDSAYTITFDAVESQV